MSFALQVSTFLLLKGEVVHEGLSPPTTTESGGAIIPRGAWTADGLG